MNLKPKTRKEYEELCKHIASSASKNATEEQRLRIEVTIAEVLANYQGEDQIIHSSELEKKAKEKALIPSMKISHREMNQGIGGIKMGQLIIMSGSVKSGKTQFLYDLVTRTMDNVKPLLLFFEDKPIDVIGKMLSHNPNYVIPEFYTPDNYSDDSLDWIKMCMLESKFKYGTKVIVIDNVHYLTQSSAQTSRYDKYLSNYSKELKDFAVKWNMAIFLIAHTNKMPEDRPPTVFDIADSAGIGQIADKVWFIKRGEDKESIWYSDRDRQTGFKGSITFTFSKGHFNESF